MPGGKERPYYQPVLLASSTSYAYTRRPNCSAEKALLRTVTCRVPIAPLSNTQPLLQESTALPPTPGPDFCCQVEKNGHHIRMVLRNSREPNGIFTQLLIAYECDERGEGCTSKRARARDIRRWWATARRGRGGSTRADLQAEGQEQTKMKRGVPRSGHSDDGDDGGDDDGGDDGGHRITRSQNQMVSRNLPPRGAHCQLK